MPKGPSKKPTMAKPQPDDPFDDAMKAAITPHRIHTITTGIIVSFNKISDYQITFGNMPCKFGVLFNLLPIGGKINSFIIFFILY